MNEILEYFKNILIIMMLSIPIYYVVRFKILKIKISNKKREIILIIFTVYMIALTLQIVTPKFIINTSGIHIIHQDLDNINIIPFYFIKDFYNECILLNNYNYLFINIFGNILLFIPIGFLLPYLFKMEYNKVMVFGIIFSCTVEIIQIWLPRVTDIDDVILNNIGIYIGILIHKNFCLRK